MTVDTDMGVHCTAQHSTTQHSKAAHKAVMCKQQLAQHITRHSTEPGTWTVYRQCTALHIQKGQLSAQPIFAQHIGSPFKRLQVGNRW